MILCPDYQVTTLLSHNALPSFSFIIESAGEELCVEHIEILMSIRWEDGDTWHKICDLVLPGHDVYIAHHAAVWQRWVRYLCLRQHLFWFSWGLAYFAKVIASRNIMSSLCSEMGANMNTDQKCSLQLVESIPYICHLRHRESTPASISSFQRPEYTIIFKNCTCTKPIG